MTLPGFTAQASLGRRTHFASQSVTRPADPMAVVPQAGLATGLGQGFGFGFGPTLPTCHWKKQWVECGSALPGYPTPMCLEWVYVCKFPGSSRGLAA